MSTSLLDQRNKDGANIGGDMPSHFGQWMRNRRDELGISANSIAVKSGYTRNYISFLELGKRLPTDDALVTLAPLLHVSLDEITMAAFPDRFDDRQRLLLRQWLASDHAPHD
jgi:transcriptional regulator with XRE-family HTH domain